LAETLIRHSQENDINNDFHGWKSVACCRLLIEFPSLPERLIRFAVCRTGYNYEEARDYFIIAEMRERLEQELQRWDSRRASASLRGDSKGLRWVFMS
jgi:hypothetical protein